jgi:carbon dioxide concentrating mechanism protein CcmK
MQEAVGMVEVLGLPPALAVADAMVKAANVMLVGYEKVSGARYTIFVRGDISEVQASVNAGVESVKQVNTKYDLLLSYHVIPRPHDNTHWVLLPRKYNRDIEAFRVRR